MALVVSIAALLPMKLLDVPPAQRAAAAASANSRFGVFAGNSNVQTVDALGQAIGRQPNLRHGLPERQVMADTH